MFSLVKLIDCKIRLIIIYTLGSGHVNSLKSSASESKPFLSLSKAEIPGLARRQKRMSRSKLK